MSGSGFPAPNAEDRRTDMVMLTLLTVVVLVGAVADARYQRWLEARGL